MSENEQAASPMTPARRYRGSFYWDAREQSLASYAVQLDHCLEQLRSRSPVLERFYIDGAAGGTLLDEHAVERLTAELTANRRTWELHGVEYAGSEVTVSNLRKGPLRCEFTLSCGITVPSTSVWFANSLTFDACAPSDAFPDLESFVALSALIVTNFAPAWGSVVTSRQEERSLEDIYGGVPQVGFLTVFAPEYGTPPPSPDYSVRLLANGSHLVRVTEEWLDDRNTAHVERRERAAQTLRAAGLLRRRLPAA
jgi:hypothetical protein